MFGFSERKVLVPRHGACWAVRRQWWWIQEERIVYRESANIVLRRWIDANYMIYACIENLAVGEKQCPPFCQRFGRGAPFFVIRPFFSARSGRDISENSKAPSFYYFFYRYFDPKSVWQFKIESFPIKVKIGVHRAEDTRRRSILVSLPNSPTIQRYCQTRFNTYLLYTRYKASNTERNDISAMHHSILRISIWKFNPVFEPQVQRYLLSA